MADVYSIVDAANDATVYFAFEAPTGAGNPNTLVTKVRSVDLGSDRAEPDIFVPDTVGDPRLLRYDLPPVPMQFIIYCSATTFDNLDAALRTLRGYLLDPTNKRLLIQPDTAAEKRYADIVIGDVPSLLRGQGTQEEYVALRDKKAVEITVTIIRKWGLRGPMQTVGPTTLPNDPADTNGRVIQVTNPGNVLTPAAVKVAGPTSARLAEYIVGRRHQNGYAATRITDYAGASAPTRHVQLSATATPWTIVLSNDTTLNTPDADASGNAAARIAGTTAVNVMNKRIRATITTKLDSLRGDWDVYMRNKLTAAARYVPQLRYGPSLADPPPFSLPEADPIDTTGLSSFAYTDHYLGRISIPTEHTLGGIALEVHVRRESGAGNLDCDFLFFVPASASDQQTRVFVPPGAKETWLGRQLVTPTAPGGLAAGTVVGDALRLDGNNEAGGTPPVGGLIWGVGRHVVTFHVTVTSQSDTMDYIYRVRNITTPGDTVSVTVTNELEVNFRRTLTLQFDGVAGQAYEPQFVVTSVSAGLDAVDVHYVSHESIPYIAVNEEAHTDPDKRLIHKMDASDNIVLSLGSDGELPIWLLPGLQFLAFIFVDVPIVSGAPGGESKLTQDYPVMLMFEPRYLT